MLESRFISALLSLGTFLTRTGGRLTAQYGISQQQAVILIAVQEQGPVSQKGIRTSLLLERSNVSKAVAGLASMGLLQTRKSEQDGRVVLLVVTPRGAEVADACMGTFNEWNQAWLEGIPKRELRSALKVLERLTSEE